MRYQLSEFYQFCGYKGLPYGLRDKMDQKITFFGEKDFRVLYSLAAGADSEGLDLDDAARDTMEHYVEKKVLTQADPEEKLPRPLPRVQRYPNLYKERVHWSITGKCNARCRHCFQSAPEALFGEPTLEQCLDIIHQLKECGVFHVDLTGGEPLIRKDFWQIIDAILENGLQVGTIYSNGFLVNQKLLDGFKERGIKPHWQISFDGIGCHDWIRGIDGAEEMAINAIKLLVQNGYMVSCAYSLFRESAEVFRESVQLLASLGVCSMKTGIMQKQGLWLNYLDHHLSDEERLAFYKKAIPQYLADGRPLSLQVEGLFMGYRDQDMEKLEKGAYQFLRKKELTPEKHDKCDACESLRHGFYLGPSGNVVPCMGMDDVPAMKNAPNVFQTPLSEILTESLYTRMAYTSVLDVEKHNPECVNCELRFQCCAGCRASALETSPDDYLGVDRNCCKIMKEDWTGQIMECINNK